MIKIANCIAIGGSIAVGKSTLVGTLPFIPIHELDDNDELQQILLKKMYEKDEIAPQVFQLDIMLQRFKTYEKHANDDKMHIFDRTIFEDYLFAKNLLEDNENFWNYYKSIWENRIDKLINEIGIPKIYIILTQNWETFYNRIHDRNREVEIVNFEKNKNYFKKLLASYEADFIAILKKYNIKYVVVDTNTINKIQVREITIEHLRKEGIINDENS